MGASHASEFNAGDLVDDMKDPGLSMCSPATRGIWFDLLCVLHELGRSGQVTRTPEQFCRACRCTPAEFVAAIAELRTTQVAESHERDGNVTVICRRSQSKLKKRVLARERVRRHRCNADVTRYTGVTKSSFEEIETIPNLPENVTPVGSGVKPQEAQTVTENEDDVKRFGNAPCNADVTLEQKESAYIYINTQEENSLEEKKNSIGAKKEKGRPKVEDLRGRHPAIQAVKAVISRYPKKELWDEIIQFLGDKPEVEKLQSCYLAWIKRGYNPLNYAWLFDWTVTGIPEKGGFRKERNEKAEINDAVKTRDTRTTEELGIRAPRRL